MSSNIFKKLTYLFTILVIGFTPLDAIEVSEGSGITLGRYFFIAMAGCAILSGDLAIKKAGGLLKVLCYSSYGHSQQFCGALTLKLL